jgi:hypothetical protein
VVDDNTPLRLDRAAQLAFPEGGMNGGGLARLGQRGRLNVFKLNGRRFTTLADIRAMIERARAGEPAQTRCPAPLESANADTAVARARQAIDQLRHLTLPPGGSHRNLSRKAPEDPAARDCGAPSGEAAQ